MRVITGTARGRKLTPPQGTDTRPTTEMVKEAVMSMIQFELPGAVFLDLFAGCGQIGIEALSRGARHCTFVDNARRARDLIAENVELAGFSAQSQVRMADALSWAQLAEGPFDIAYLDPPYEQGLPNKLLPLLAGLMRANGVILVETARNEVLPKKAGDFRLVREYHYGKKKISKYQAGQGEDAQ